MAGTVLLCVLGINAVLLQEQIGIWKNSLNLWNRVIELYPGIIGTPYKNRGAAYFEAGDLQRAIENWSTAIQITPGDSTTYVNRASALLRVGNTKGALEDFVKAARLGNVFARQYLASSGINWR
jgi:tetratricopeptide (TPR) repeat protein